MRIFASAVAILLALGMPVSAELTRIDGTSRTDVLGGKEFGAGGRYEKIVGKVVFAVDLDNPPTAQSSISTRRSATLRGR
jgi:hypothetical protein